MAAEYRYIEKELSYREQAAILMTSFVRVLRQYLRNYFIEANSCNR